MLDIGTYGAGVAYPSVVPDINPGFGLAGVAQRLVFCASVYKVVCLFFFFGRFLPLHR